MQQMVRRQAKRLARLTDLTEEEIYQQIRDCERFDEVVTRMKKMSIRKLMRPSKQSGELATFKAFLMGYDR